MNIPVTGRNREYEDELPPLISWCEVEAVRAKALEQWAIEHPRLRPRISPFDTAATVNFRTPWRIHE